jgi:GNAT superfamily N-acetyltransferase
LSEFRVRAARPEDAELIAGVHVQAWRESYRGLVPDRVIEALSVERNTQMWADILAGGDSSIVHVVEQVGAGGIEPEVVGFGSASATRTPELGRGGEVTAIYLLEKCKRRGIGRVLLIGLLRALAEYGHRSAGLWVLAGNYRTRRFYEALGGRPGPQRILSDAPAEMHEIAYVWDDLSGFGSTTGLRSAD